MSTIIRREFVLADLYDPIAVSADRGRFRAKLRIGYDDATKSYIHKSFFGADAVEVRSKVFDYIQSRIDGQEEEKRVDALLSTDFERYLYDEKYGTLKAGSFDRCEGIYQHQILPYIAGITVQGCKPSDCKKVMDANLAQGYSYSTLLKTYQLLNEYFERRRKSGVILLNPMDGVKMYSKDFVLTRQQQLREEREKAVKKEEAGAKMTPAEINAASSRLKMEDKDEIRILSDDEIARIREICENGYFVDYKSRSGNPVRSGPYFLSQPEFFLFLLNTGLRRGEALALKYSDVDFERKTLTIRRNVTISKRRDADGHTTGGIIVTETTPKTKKSAAVLPVSDAALEILRDMHCDEDENYQGYIVHGNGGCRFGETGLRKRWAALLRWANIPPCGLHSLRHTFASRLYAATGGDSKLVSEMVRHSNVAFTENIYVHLIESYRENLLKDFSI